MMILMTIARVTLMMLISQEEDVRRVPEPRWSSSWCGSGALVQMRHVELMAMLPLGALFDVGSFRDLLGWQP